MIDWCFIFIFGSNKGLSSLFYAIFISLFCAILGLFSALCKIFSAWTLNLSSFGFDLTAPISSEMASWLFLSSDFSSLFSFYICSIYSGMSISVFLLVFEGDLLTGFYWNLEALDTLLLIMLLGKDGGAIGVVSSSLMVFLLYFFFVLSTELLFCENTILFEKLWWCLDS